MNSNFKRIKVKRFVEGAGFLLLFLVSFFCNGQSHTLKTDDDISMGAERLPKYASKLAGKRIAVVANHTAVVEGEHLVDYLLQSGLNVTKVFSPEHGFRGTADAGETVKSKTDSKTGLPIISLYNSKKKPSKADLKNVDVVIFDIQDVGVRFYTYISTLHYLMEACAENDKKLWVLDRPNPNGFYVDGPVLEPEQKSFVGLDPIPVVHGCTVGELAKMINGEGWLEGELVCDLTVIEMENYSHSDLYQLPIDPSPNLRTMNAIYFYPSVALFEGTVMSVGRGTDFPFEVFGHPDLKVGKFYFTPEPSHGAKNPKLKGEKCRGFDLRKLDPKFMMDTQRLYLNWLKIAYENYPDKDNFFLKNQFFNLLAGNSSMMNSIEESKSIEAIRKSWQPQLDEYRETRKKYILYPDFE
ncbi:DUF1343 domain-containing protein [Salibacter sp.]|uniref:exo-beta-N-acetylmuramidase NamZ family protein n=1 Tax=Salibacter sp. TaxID=2010995 RepID=UPI0028703808|nr:DUF1343 domain-containing protein [Salibacter sp.]MDR9486457.1 DUF1343 domain-containing protein [Salibacter sp.]